jgi:hypothetical protein
MAQGTRNGQLENGRTGEFHVLLALSPANQQLCYDSSSCPIMTNGYNGT